MGKKDKILGRLEDWSQEKGRGVKQGKGWHYGSIFEWSLIKSGEESKVHKFKNYDCEIDDKEEMLAYGMERRIKSKWICEILSGEKW